MTSSLITSYQFGGKKAKIAGKHSALASYTKSNSRIGRVSCNKMDHKKLGKILKTVPYVTFFLIFKYPVNAKIEKILFLVPNLEHYSSNLKTPLV